MCIRSRSNNWTSRLVRQRECRVFCWYLVLAVFCFGIICSMYYTCQNICTGKVASSKIIQFIAMQYKLALCA